METRRALWAAVLTVCALSLACWAHDRNFFWHCDYPLWYTPYYDEIARAWGEGDWPILSRNTWAGGNLAGEYQCGTFSLFHNLALVLLWKLPLSLPGKAAAFSTLHLSVLAAGAVLLARQRGLGAAVAAGVGIVAAWNGWLITWGASQWSVALTGFAWLPWAWWAFAKALQSEDRRTRWLLPAPFVYLLIAAGSPFAVVMLGIVTVWLAARAGRRSAPLAAGCALGLALSAPAWLMLIEMHRYSVRADWGWAIQWNWTVPWRAWPALWLPSLTTLWQDFHSEAVPHIGIEMAGALVPASAVVALLVTRRREAWARYRWELGLLLGLMVLTSVPLVGSFRWSFRFLPLFHLVLALLGAEALSLLGSSFVAAMGLMLVSVTALLGSNARPALIWWELAILLAWWAAARWVTPSRWLSTAVTAALLLAAFLFVPTTQSSLILPFGENLRRPEPLERERLYLSLFSFTDLLHAMSASPANWGAVMRPGNTALCADLHLLNGYSSFNALGVPALFEPFGSVNPAMSERLLSPESQGLLDLLGVDGLIFGPEEWPLIARLGPEWRQVFSSSEAKVFHREPARAAPVKALASYDPEPQLLLAQPQLDVVRESRQRLVVNITPSAGERTETSDDVGVLAPTQDAPAVIAFLRPYFPGYVATFNGQPLAVEAYAGIVPAVHLPPGARGTLVLRYLPSALTWGAAAAAAGAGMWLVLFVRFRPARRWRPADAKHSR